MVTVAFCVFSTAVTNPLEKAQKALGMEKHIKRVQSLDAHVKEHPKDYQAVVALLKARSDAIEHRAWLRMIERKKAVAEIRKERRNRHGEE